MEVDEMEVSASTSKSTRTELSSSSDEYDSDISMDEAGPSVVDNLNENYEDELETAFNKPREKRDKQVVATRQSRVSKSKLPTHLKGLMGEANLRLARGDTKTAESICLELVRQEPYASEPYVTLSQLYESSHIEKSMEFLTIAAHLNSTCIDSWLRLAQYYTEEKPNFKKAVTCLSKAIKVQPKNYSLYNQRISLLEELYDVKNIYRCKAQLLQMYSKRHVNNILELAKEIAVHYREEKEYQKAIDSLNVAFKKCRKHIPMELVNIYLDVLLLNENYPQCLDVFLQFVNIEMEICVSEDNIVNVLSYTMPDTIQIDLKTKFIVCLIKLSAFDLVKLLVGSLLDDESNVEKHGDLYLDISEAFMSMKKYKEALELLIPLTKSSNFSLAAVWLRHAECLKECNLIQSAIESYYHVYNLAPETLEVRHPLSELLINSGRHEEAFKVMKQEYEASTVDVSLLVKHMNLSLEMKKMDEYFICAETLLKRHCVIFQHYNELRLSTFQETVPEKLARINKFRDFKNAPHVSMNVVSIREPSIEEEYETYQSVLRRCYADGYYRELKKFAFFGLCSTRFKAYVYEITLIALYACLLTKDVYLAFPILRDLIFRNFREAKLNYLLWNVFILTQQIDTEMTQSKFVIRLSKSRKFEFLKIIEACFHLSNGSYKFANIYLMPLLKNPSSPPFINFLLGVSFSMVSISARLYTKEMKKKMTLCCFAFFSNYAAKRGKLAQPEVWYNLARINHHFGVLQAAVHYYRLVLDFKHPLYEEHAPILDLKREAAYNLMLVYKESDNFIGARNIMLYYLTI